MNPSGTNDARFWPQGTVYGALLNFQQEWNLRAPQMTEAPYKGAPQAPVLFIKTANTYTASGVCIAIPDGVAEVDIGANLAWVFGADAKPVACVLVNDVSIPHESYYRPPVKFKCVDGFLGVGSKALGIAQVKTDAVVLTVKVNGKEVQRVNYADTVRKSQTLLSDISEFMTFQEGDVLLLGSDCMPNGKRPRAKVGDVVEISADGFDTLVNTFVGGAA
ncbi:MAG: fumarylacetoacetate hydrolase [Betaproteobacteria bacterium]|nr:fumarylacetoacetate hydrolase [Betaproteobacteria bacterium]